MSKLLTPFKILLNKALGLSGALYVLFILIIVVIIGGGGYFWNKKGINKALPSQTSLSTSPSEAAKEITDESAEESAEEEENAEEDNSSAQDSPWSLLKTALPTRYYEPSVNTQTPSVAIILTGLGLNKSWTHHVLTTLKGKITLAFSPYSQNLDDQLQWAASLGHEVLIALPMEPYTYPNPDPGPHTLLTGVNPEENVVKTKAILEKAPQGIGVIGEHGSRFVISQPDLEPVLREIKNQGRIFVDSNTSLYSQVQPTCKILDMPCHQVDLNLPLSTNLNQPDEFLKKIVQSAKENGIIIITVPAIPAFMKHLDKWIDTLTENGVNLVKMTNIKTPKHSPNTTGDNNQGVKDALRQDPH